MARIEEITQEIINQERRLRQIESQKDSRDIAKIEGIKKKIAELKSEIFSHQSLPDNSQKPIEATLTRREPEGLSKAAQADAFAQKIADFTEGMLFDGYAEKYSSQYYYICQSALHTRAFRISSAANK